MLSVKCIFIYQPCLIRMVLECITSVQGSEFQKIFWHVCTRLFSVRPSTIGSVKKCMWITVWTVCKYRTSLCMVTLFVLQCVGDVKGAARDTNRLYHRKHLYHYEYKSVQCTSSRNVLDLLTTPSGATCPRAQSINPIHLSNQCYNYCIPTMQNDWILMLFLCQYWLCIQASYSPQQL